VRKIEEKPPVIEITPDKQNLDLIESPAVKFKTEFDLNEMTP